MGQGSIHAGFQQCSVMAQQQSVYTDLARRGVSVHTYGVPDATPPDLGSGHAHAVSTDEISETWFVVFDGGSDDTQKTASLAHERDENVSTGCGRTIRISSTASSLISIRPMTPRPTMYCQVCETRKRDFVSDRASRYGRLTNA
ncbi:hypothetical protein QA599_08950 [Haloarculaceae archaeon H-GB1-1]|nr:hypothetical protein [Haloarculaceae archaeon H-GB1-1]